MESAVRTSSSPPGNSALSSHAAQAALFALLMSLAGLTLSIGALFLRRSPLTFFGVILVAGLLFVLVGYLLSMWFKKYGRRRSRQGSLARGQGAAMFAFCGWLLLGAMFLVHFSLAAVRWRGF